MVKSKIKTKINIYCIIVYVKNKGTSIKKCIIDLKVRQREVLNNECKRNH